MALTVEDGTGIAGANSYVSLDDARTWASLRGLSLPADDSAAEQALIKAVDYIEHLRDRFSGSKTDPDQALQWPRAGAYRDGVEIGDDVIPEELISAQVQLAIDSVTTELQPNGIGRETSMEKVDVIEVRYFERGSGTVKPQFTKAMDFLTCLFKVGAGSFRTLRI